MNFEGAEGLEFGGGNVNVDPAVLAKLPLGCKVISTESHGVSFWAETGRINASLPDGSEQSFFIKLLSKDRGRDMVRGEFASMSAIYDITPHFAPRPIAWGACTSQPETYFFLCEFRDMAGDMPEPQPFAAALSTMHLKSQSPTGMFGFHETTCAGNLPQMVEWESSWQTFFAKSLRWSLDLEIAAKGHDPEFDVLGPLIFDRVIPRLLGPLESDGRKVKPSLIHGDLWFANSGVDVKDDKPLIFDACCFYAHNEYEFGQWRPTCNRFGDEYMNAYTSFVKPSYPEEDFEGRLDLYRLRFDTHVSALFVDNEGLRTQVLDDMRDLIKRYGQEIPAPEAATPLLKQQPVVAGMQDISLDVPALAKNAHDVDIAALASSQPAHHTPIAVMQDPIGI